MGYFPQTSVRLWNFVHGGSKNAKNPLPLRAILLTGSTNYKESTAPLKMSRREKFSNCGFFWNSLGLAVGVGNILRFPYKLEEHDGLPFLIAYFFMFFLVGLPMLIIENSLGQYSGQGPTKVFGQMVPGFRGLGYSMLFVRMLVNTYSPVVMAWSLYYFGVTIGSVLTQNDLPWTGCNNSWNTDDCSLDTIMPAQQYFQRNTLNTQGEWSWSVLFLAFTLFLSWLAAFFILFWGAKSMELASWPAVIIPYFVLGAMIFYPACASLDYGGFGFMFKSLTWYDFLWKMVDIKLWADAASQIIFSLGIGYGSVINTSRCQSDFRKSTMRHSLLIGGLNAATSFIAGGVVFSFLGLLSEESGIKMEDLIQGDVGLVLVVFPAAFSKGAIMAYPVGVCYSLFFFMTLVLLALSSLIGGVKVFWDAFDVRPWCEANKKKTLSMICAAHFIVGLIFCTSKGFYLYSLLDKHCTNSLLLICFMENFHISWVFTPFRPLWSMKKWLEMHDDMGMSTKKGCRNRTLRFLLILTWRYLTPVALFCSVVYNFVIRFFEPLGPWYGFLIGMIIEAIPIIILVSFMVDSICKKGSKRSFKPTEAWRFKDVELELELWMGKLFSDEESAHLA